MVCCAQANWPSVRSLEAVSSVAATAAAETCESQSEETEPQAPASSPAARDEQHESIAAHPTSEEPQQQVEGDLAADTGEAPGTDSTAEAQEEAVAKESDPAETAAEGSAAASDQRENDGKAAAEASPATLPAAVRAEAGTAVEPNLAAEPASQHNVSEPGESSLGEQGGVATVSGVGPVNTAGISEDDEMLPALMRQVGARPTASLCSCCYLQCITWQALLVMVMANACASRAFFLAGASITVRG